MAKITVSAEKVLETLREVAAERPDYVYTRPEHMEGEYPRCNYVHISEDGQPAEAGCIVGQVLARLGVPLSELREADVMGRASAVVPAFLDIIGDENRVMNILCYAQRNQDGGFLEHRMPWAEAVASAEARVSEFAAVGVDALV